MGREDTSAWMTSRDLLEALFGRRDNDVKVDINDILVPVKSVKYHDQADAYVIELVDGADLRIALTTDAVPTVDQE